LYAQPTSRDQRADVAKACVLGLDLAMPTLLDDMNDSTNLAYAAIPEKLYLIDAEGLVRFRTGPGPWFFDPEAWDRAIKSLVEGGV